jgi:hypothetical protein
VEKKGDPRNEDKIHGRRKGDILILKKSRKEKKNDKIKVRRQPHELE